MVEFDSTYLLLCFNRVPPLAIEIICSFFCIIGGVITFLGLSRIPFYIDSNIYKLFFFINIPYFIIMIIFNILFLFFRFFDLINNELNLWSYGLSVIEIYIALFGIITSLINDSLIISNMKYYYQLSLKRKSPKYPMIKPEEWFYTKIILPIILFIWTNMLLMSLTDNLLINLKINGSYHQYELALEDDRRQSENHRNSSNNDSNSNNNGENNINVQVNINANSNDTNINNNNINTNDNNNDNTNRIINTNEIINNNINNNNINNMNNNENNNYIIDNVNNNVINVNESNNNEKKENNNNIRKKGRVRNSLASSNTQFLNEEFNIEENLKENEEKKY